MQQCRQVRTDFRGEIDLCGIDDWGGVALAHSLSLWPSASSEQRGQPPTMGPYVSRACPETGETPCNTYPRHTVAQTSHAICDILAKNVEIMRKTWRTHLSAGRQRATPGRLPSSYLLAGGGARLA